MGGIAVQAVPRLAEKLGIDHYLPPERMLYGSGLADLVGAISRYEDALRLMMAEHSISWREVYEASDVGRERMALIDKIGLDQDDLVLDVGCGKGFTTAALAFDSSLVGGLDLMNGFGRAGWWASFRMEMASLGVRDKTSGLRGSAAEVPYRDGGVHPHRLGSRPENLREQKHRHGCAQRDGEGYLERRSRCCLREHPGGLFESPGSSPQILS